MYRLILHISDGGPTDWIFLVVVYSFSSDLYVCNWIKHSVEQPEASELQSWQISLKKQQKDWQSFLQVCIRLVYKTFDYAQMGNIRFLFEWLGMWWTNYTVKIYHHIVTYPFIVFAIDICSFIDKEFCCYNTTFFNCNMQGSPLIEKLKQSSMNYWTTWFRNWLISYCNVANWWKYIISNISDG